MSCNELNVNERKKKIASLPDLVYKRFSSVSKKHVKVKCLAEWLSDNSLANSIGKTKEPVEFGSKSL